jgi:hypothetical protein
MGLFSKLFGRKKDAPRNNGSKSFKTTKSSKSAPIETYVVTDSMIVTAPIGNVRGTELSEAIIRSCVTSVLKNQGSKVNQAIIDLMAAPFDFASSGYSHNTERGYAAIVLDTETEGLTKNPLQRRVLIGGANFVGLATTSFHSDIAAIIAKDLSADSTLHVVAIDGIAYAAFVVKREVK